MAGAEAFGYELAGVGAAGVVGLDVADAAPGEEGAEAECGGLGVAIDAAIDDDDGLVFGLVAAPKVVLGDKPFDILAPDGAVERAYHLDVQRGGFLEEGLHLHTVFADDVDEVASGVVEPFAGEVELIGIEVAAERAEGAEGVGGEEDVVGGVVGDHHLGPVDHGGHGEGEGVATQREGVALFDDDMLICRHVGTEELLHHLRGLGGAHHRGFGVAQQQVGQRGGMVGLHVVDNHIVQLTARKGGGHILEELLASRGIDRVEQRSLLIQK